jgi:hypothetical protein
MPKSGRSFRRQSQLLTTECRMTWLGLTGIRCSNTAFGRTFAQTEGWQRGSIPAFAQMICIAQDSFKKA